MVFISTISFLSNYITVIPWYSFLDNVPFKCSFDVCVLTSQSSVQCNTLGGIQYYTKNNLYKFLKMFWKLQQCSLSDWLFSFQSNQLRDSNTPWSLNHSKWTQLEVKLRSPGFELLLDAPMVWISKLRIARFKFHSFIPTNLGSMLLDHQRFLAKQ